MKRARSEGAPSDEGMPLSSGAQPPAGLSGDPTTGAVGTLSGRVQTSVYRGVSLKAGRKSTPWKAVITVQNQTKHLGYYASEELAAVAYDAHARQYGRETNFQLPEALAGARPTAAATLAQQRQEQEAEAQRLAWLHSYRSPVLAQRGCATQPQHQALGCEGGGGGEGGDGAGAPRSVACGGAGGVALAAHTLLCAQGAGEMNSGLGAGAGAGSGACVAFGAGAGAVPAHIDAEYVALLQQRLAHATAHAQRAQEASQAAQAQLQMALRAAGSAVLASGGEIAAGGAYYAVGPAGAYCAAEAQGVGGWYGGGSADLGRAPENFGGGGSAPHGCCMQYAPAATLAALGHAVRPGHPHLQLQLSADFAQAAFGAVCGGAGAQGGPPAGNCGYISQGRLSPPLQQQQSSPQLMQRTPQLPHHSLQPQHCSPQLPYHAQPLPLHGTPLPSPQLVPRSQQLAQRVQPQVMQRSPLVTQRLLPLPQRTQVHVVQRSLQTQRRSPQLPPQQPQQPQPQQPQPQQLPPPQQQPQQPQPQLPPQELQPQQMQQMQQQLQQLQQLQQPQEQPPQPQLMQGPAAAPAATSAAIVDNRRSEEGIGACVQDSTHLGSTSTPCAADGVADGSAVP